MCRDSIIRQVDVDVDGGREGVADVEMTLHESADQLGVHYMTVYRYVRLGLLRADKVKGTWRVLASDLDEFQRSASAAVVADTGGRRRAPWAERIEARLVAGDAQGSWGVVEAALASGAKLDDVYLDLLAPAMRSIAVRWQAGELDVSIERRAEVIAIRLVGRLGPRFTRRGRNKGAVVVGGTVGEPQVVGIAIAMTADILRQHGWDVSDLGVDVPPSGFEYMVRTLDGVVAVGLSVSSAASLDSTAESIAMIRQAAPEIMIAVGGAGMRGQDHAVSLGADHWTADARQLAELLELTDRAAAHHATA